MCAQRAKEQRRGASADTSKHAEVHNVIGGVGNDRAK